MSATVTTPDRDRRADKGACWVCGRSAIPHPSHACRRCREGKAEDWKATTPPAPEAQSVREPTERHGFDLGRVCECGCGERVYGFRPTRNYASVECRNRAQDARDETKAALAPLNETPATKGSERMGLTVKGESKYDADYRAKVLELAKSGLSQREIGERMDPPTSQTQVSRIERAAGFVRAAPAVTRKPAPKKSPLAAAASNLARTIPAKAKPVAKAMGGGWVKPVEDLIVPRAPLSGLTLGPEDVEAFAVAVCIRTLGSVGAPVRASVLELLKLKFEGA